MRKDKKTNPGQKEHLKTVSDSHITASQHSQQETDEMILEQINKRKDENQALKKLLKNLNSTLYNGK